MKAILIDSKNKIVKDVEISEKSTLKDWYKQIGCSMVEVAAYIDAQDSILVDEEGLYNITAETGSFYYKGVFSQLYGNGLVVGVDNKGNSVSCKITALEVAKNVVFL